MSAVPTDIALATEPGHGRDDGLPLIGYSIQFARGRMLATHEWYERFGPVSHTKAVGVSWVNVEGPEAWKVMRTLMGTTNPREAAPGTIRGDLAVELTENLVHGSDGPESAEREIGIFFPALAGG